MKRRDVFRKNQYRNKQMNIQNKNAYQQQFKKIKN